MKAVVLAVAVAAICSSPSTSFADSDHDPTDAYWGQVQGLMLGVTITHCQQPLAAWLEDDIEFRDKHVVSIGGCVLYGASFATAMMRSRRGLWINIIGPAVGITSVTAGWILSETGTINANVRPDTYQIMGGILQMAALYRSIQLLRAGKRAEPAKLGVTVGAGTIGVRGSW